MTDVLGNPHAPDGNGYCECWDCPKWDGAQWWQPNRWAAAGPKKQGGDRG